MKNGITGLFHVNAKFYNTDEIVENLEASGFRLEKRLKAGTVQVVCLRK